MCEMMLRISFSIILACTLALPLAASAQLTLSYPRQLTLTLSPENPAPGETVRLSVQSYTMDLDRSTITWSANGTPFAGGVGLKEASIVAGPVGAATRLRVQASDPDGNAGAAEASIQPSEMDILWSTDSYVPSFHHGRALAGTNAKVRAYAFVSFARAGGPRIPESDIIYRWLRNGTAITSVSGRGKSSASFPGPAPLRSDTITVEAEAVDKSVSARASATIPATEPVLALYENHPLFGILFHRAIVGDVNTDEHEEKVTAIPYFAHISSLNDPTLSYEWRVNDMPITPDSEEPETLTITADEYTGPADIELSLTNAADIFMRSLGRWRLVFGGETGIFFGGSSVFGE